MAYLDYEGKVYKNGQLFTKQYCDYKSYFATDYHFILGEGDTFVGIRKCHHVDVYTDKKYMEDVSFYLYNKMSEVMGGYRRHRGSKVIKLKTSDFFIEIHGKYLIGSYVLFVKYIDSKKDVWVAYCSMTPWQPSRLFRFNKDTTHYVNYLTKKRHTVK